MQLLIEEFFRKVFGFVDSMFLPLRVLLKVVFGFMFVLFLYFLFWTVLTMRYWILYLMAGLFIIGEVAHYIRKGREKIIIEDVKKEERKKKILKKNQVIKSEAIKIAKQMVKKQKSVKRIGFGTLSTDVKVVKKVPIDKALLKTEKSKNKGLLKSNKPKNRGLLKKSKKIVKKPIKEIKKVNKLTKVIVPLNKGLVNVENLQNKNLLRKSNQPKNKSLLKKNRKIK